MFVNMRINHGLCEIVDVMFSDVCDGLVNICGDSGNTCA